MTSKYSFILYEDKNSPKYFQIEKRKVKFLIFGFPAIALISILLIFFSYTRERGRVIITENGDSKTSMTSQLEVEKKMLEQEILELKSTETELLKKLESQGAKLTVTTLHPFQTIPGSSDITSSSTIKIDPGTIIVEGETRSIKFNLVNSNPELKVSGYIFVLRKGESSLSIYPKQDTFDSPLMFSKGEPFTMSRLRPVDAKFPKGETETSGNFTLVIFTRTGDLLYKSPITLP